MTMTLSGSGTIGGLVAGGLPDATITQPDLAAGVAGNGPAFSAYRSTNQTGISSGVATKVQLTSELFDTANCFDSATNYRFTPNVAGYYQINHAVYMTGTNLQYPISSIYKNGTQYAAGVFGSTLQGDYSSVGSSLVYLNGTTDYIELYASSLSTGTYTVIGNQTYTYFSGCLVRAA